MQSQQHLFVAACKHNIQIRPLPPSSMSTEVFQRVRILLVPKQQATNEYYICLNGEIDNLASQHKLTASIWRLPARQKAGQLGVALHPQPLLQHSEVAESQTEIHSRPGTSFVRLTFHLTRAIFPFLVFELLFLCAHTPPLPAECKPSLLSGSGLNFFLF